MNYHVYDETTPWCSFLQYCEICYQLNIPEQPSVGRFTAYNRYYRSVVEKND